MKGQRKIRGVGDDVWLTIAPDPINETKRPMLHVCVGATDGVAMLSLAGASRMHAALGALLKEHDRGR